MNAKTLIGVGFLLEYIRYMANLLVSTNNIDERVRLEEQFYIHDSHYVVPKDANGTLEAIFRAISFEYFQNSPSPLVHKIIAFAENLINNVCSLTFLRQIIGIIKSEQDQLKMYRQYFVDINKQLGEKEFARDELGLSEEYSVEEQNDRLFDLASRGALRLTKNIDSTDFQQIYEVGFKQYCPLAISEKTQLPSVQQLNPEQKGHKSKQDNSNQLSIILQSAENYYGNEWWRQDKPNESSKEISRFDCKASNPFNQKSIGRLVIEQFKYDLNRQIELGKQINKHEEVEGFKYKKMMKDKLLSAKLKKKKKK